MCKADRFDYITCTIYNPSTKNDKHTNTYRAVSYEYIACHKQNELCGVIGKIVSKRVRYYNRDFSPNHFYEEEKIKKKLLFLYLEKKCINCKIYA